MKTEINLEACIQSTKNSGSMTRWMKTHKEAYKWAYSNGRLRDVIEATKWTVRTNVIKISEIIGSAKNYKHKSDWQCAVPSLYALAKYYGVFELCTEHMTPKTGIKRANKRVLTKALCIDIASTCKTRTEFKNKDAGAYNCARNNQFLDECCAHMQAPSLV